MRSIIKYIAPVVLASVLTISSCSTFDVTSGTSQTIVQTATYVGLLAITNATTRTTVANYIDVYASALRTVTGTPTNEQLISYLNGFVPSDIKTKYPELGTFVTPLIVAEYQRVIAANKDNVSKVYAGINSIATSLEAGAAGFVTK